MVNQSFMRICDFLNRAGGVKGWQDLRENDSKRYELEEEYKAQKNRPDLFKVTVLATGKLVDSQVVTQNELPKDYSEEKLRADIFAWSGSRPPKVVYMYDPSSGREEMNVVLTNLKYAESDRAAEEKLEKERPRDVTTVDRAESALKNSTKRARPVKKTLYVTCGVSEGRRRRKLKTGKTRAQKERFRQRNRKEMLKIGKKRKKHNDCSSAAVDNVSAFTGRGKSVSKAAVDLGRLKLMGDKYEPKAHHCLVAVERPIQKLLLSAHIGIRKKAPHPKRCAEWSQEEVSAEQQSRQERKKWNSGWRKAAMYELGVQRKSKPASHSTNTMVKEGLAVEKEGLPVEKVELPVEKEGLAVEKKDSGKSVVAGMLDMLIGDVVKIVDLKSPVMTEDESEESNVKEDNLWNDTEHGLTSSGDEECGEVKVEDVSFVCVSEQTEKKGVCDVVVNGVVENVLTTGVNNESSSVLLPEKTDCALAGDDQEKEESAYEEDLEVNQNVSDSVMRLRGGGDVLLTEDFDGFQRKEVIECLLALNVNPDQSQATENFKNNCSRFKYQTLSRSRRRALLLKSSRSTTCLIKTKKGGSLH